MNYKKSISEIDDFLNFESSLTTQEIEIAKNCIFLIEKNRYDEANFALKDLLNCLKNNNKNIIYHDSFYYLIESIINKFVPIDMEIFLNTFNIIVYLKNNTDIFMENSVLKFLKNCILNDEFDQSLRKVGLQIFFNIIHDSTDSKILLLKELISNIISNLISGINVESEENYNEQKYFLLQFQLFTDILSKGLLDPNIFTDLFYMILRKCKIDLLPDELIKFMILYLSQLNQKEIKIEIIKVIIPLIDFHNIYNTFLTFNEERVQTLLLFLQLLLDNTKTYVCINSMIQIDFCAIKNYFDANMEKCSLLTKINLCNLMNSYVTSPSFNIFSSFYEIFPILISFTNKEFQLIESAIYVLISFFQKFGKDLDYSIYHNCILNTNFIEFLIEIIENHPSDFVISNSISIIISIIEAIHVNPTLDDCSSIVNKISDFLNSYSSNNEQIEKLKYLISLSYQNCF